MSSRRYADGPAGRHLLGWLVAVAAVLGLSGAAWAVPEVRSVLRDSFTERQQAYIELYLAKDPWYDGNELVVPLEVVEHGESGGRHPVQALAEDTDGKRLAARTVTVTTKPGAQISVDIRLRTKGGGRNVHLVEVALPGHPQRLRVHLR